MTKNVDVDLRIRAKNQAGKTLEDINAQVEKLTKSQKEQASSSALAAKATRELVADQKALASATAELTRRRNLASQFKDQQKEIGATALKLRELTAQYREMQASGKGGGGTIIGFSDKDMAKVGAEVVRTERQLNTLVTSTTKLGTKLNELGVDAAQAGSEIARLDGYIAASTAAYDGATAAVVRHGDATEKANAAKAEAIRREADLAAQVKRNQQAFGASAGRAGELAALRADIEARSEQARAIGVSAEATRRLAAEQATTSAAEARATANIRQTVSAYDALRQRRADAIAAFGPEFAAQQRSNAVRDRLAALLNTERGQRILTAEATRRETGETVKNTAAHERNNVAVQKGAAGVGLFNDIGRKSLSTYQRLRGQVLGLAAAYIGVYQAINTFNKAIDATTRNQSLRVGLSTINNGDAKAAASDYKFLADQAERLGLVFDSTAPQFANLAISGKAVGLSGEQIRKTFKDVSTSAAAMNLSVEDTEGVFRAVTQIFSKGKVQAEELRGQLGDRLPGAVVKFAQASKISLTDLDKKLKEGSLGIDFLITGLDAYAKQFDSSMGDVTDRLQAHINRATTAYDNFLRMLLTGANDARIKDAFDRITKFFTGADGEKFAASLTTALGKAIDFFIFLADNAEKVMTVLKLLLALQVAKFFADVGTSVLGAGKAIFDFNTKIRAAIVATDAAALSGTKLATSTRLLALAFGPVGIAIATVTGLVFGYINSISAATAKTEDYTRVLGNLTFARGVDGIGVAMQGTRDKVIGLNDEIQKLLVIQKDLKSLNLSTSGAAAIQFYKEGFATTGQLQDRINQALKQQRFLTDSLVDGQVRLSKAKAEQADIDAKAAKDAKTAVTVTGDPKTPKVTGPSVGDTARQQEDVARKAKDEILSLQDDILQAQMRDGATTQDMLDKNLGLQLQRNQIAYDDEALKIEKLRAQAANAAEDAAKHGRPAVDISNELTQLEGLAQRRQAVADQAAKEQNAVDTIALREKAINDLLDERNAKIALYAAQATAGTIGQGEAYALTIKAQDEYNAKINAAAADQIAFLTELAATGGLPAGFKLDETIAKLQQIQAETVKLTTTQKFFKNYGDQIASGFGNAFTVFAKGIAGAIQQTNSLGDAFTAAGDAFRNFAADFLQQIAEMIIQQLILYTIQVLTGTAEGGFSLTTALGGGYSSKHKGGIVGKNDNGNVKRNVDPRVFIGAGKFHEGGLPGLKTNEIPIIAKRGEEVLSEDNPRNVLNGGGQAAARQPDITVVNTTDSASIVQQGFQSNGTMRVVLNTMKANKNAFRQALGIKN